MATTGSSGPAPTPVKAWSLIWQEPREGQAQGQALRWALEKAAGCEEQQRVEISLV